MRAYRRRGFTLVEEAIVIAIIAILAIPVATLMSQIARNQVYGTEDIKGQYAMNVIMQDIEQRIRRANNGSIAITTGNPYRIAFTYVDANSDGSKKAIQPLYCQYELDDAGTASSVFGRGIGTSASPTLSIFPAGLEPGIAQSFTATLSSSAPYTLSISLVSSTGTSLQKMIYLLNYAQ
ncbi:MAG: prepilin-type N-terminal cleavage/methylation domain-containing protein [Caldiserica bacterium]|nr:prepilin-type N-terminal cleavage/methylation domain-containing protein [Caldisericota bacterium]